MLVIHRRAGIPEKDGFSLERNGEEVARVQIMRTAGREVVIGIEAPDDVSILRDDAVRRSPNED